MRVSGDAPDSFLTRYSANLLSFLALMDSIKADHGYNMDSRSVKNLLQSMSELTLPQRREFLQFTTGSPKLPIGGMFVTGDDGGKLRPR